MLSASIWKSKKYNIHPLIQCIHSCSLFHLWLRFDPESASIRRTINHQQWQQPLTHHRPQQFRPNWDLSINLRGFPPSDADSPNAMVWRLTEHVIPSSTLPPVPGFYIIYIYFFEVTWPEIDWLRGWEAKRLKTHKWQAVSAVSHWACRRHFTKQLKKRARKRGKERECVRER